MGQLLLNQLEVLSGRDDPRLHDPLVVSRVPVLLSVGVGVGLASLA